MKTSGHADSFIRLAVEQGVGAFDNKVKRSLLDQDNPGYQPLFLKAGWRKNLRAKAKALKRATWFRGMEKESGDSWDPLSPTRTGGRIGKAKKIFRKAGKKS